MSGSHAAQKRNRPDQDTISAIEEAIEAADAAEKRLNALLEEWQNSNPTCFAVIESNHGYHDSWIKSYHLTREDAEKSKPADLNSGWEPTTYFVDKKETKSLSQETLKKLFRKK